MTNEEAAKYLGAMAASANMLARLYEEAAATVAGFPTEADYQAEAAEAFESDQASIDQWETAR